MELIERISWIAIEVSASVGWGTLLAISLWIRPRELSQAWRSPRIRMKVFATIILVTIPSAYFMNTANFSEEFMKSLLLVPWIAIVFRLFRMKVATIYSSYILNVTTLLDVGLIRASLLLFTSWASAIQQGQLMSIKGAFTFPALYVIVCIYMIYNYQLFWPNKFLIGRWLLLAYAFPEGKKHRKGSIGKTRHFGITVSRVIGWSLFLILGFLGWLFWYWLSGYKIPTMLYITLIVVASIIYLFKNRVSIKSVKGVEGKAAQILVGSGIILLFYTFLFLLIHGRLWALPSTGDRAMGALALSAPFLVLFIQLLPDLAKRMLNYWQVSLKQSPTLKAIIDIAESVRIAAFSEKTVGSLQALLLAAIFLIYFLLPKSEPLLTAIGISELWGRSIADLLNEFKEMSLTWTDLDSDDPNIGLRFIFGNQGLVLLFLSWSGITLLAWSDMMGRLNDIPKLFTSRFSRFLSALHIPFFYLFFFPFLLVIALMIPLLGLLFTGYSFAIILSVLSFGLILPRIVSFLLSVGYLVTTCIGAREDRHAIDINGASFEELTLLPSVGPMLAHRIIQGRPYTKVHDLKRVQGIGGRIYALIEELTRI